MAYRSFVRFWQASSPASIRRPPQTVITQFPGDVPVDVEKGMAALLALSR